MSQARRINPRIDVFETTRLNEAAWEIYEARLKWLRDQASILRTAEIKKLEKGRQEGVTDTARNMKESGVDFNTIAKCTGLSIDYIQKL